MLLLIVGDPNSLEAGLWALATGQARHPYQLTLFISFHRKGAVTSPCRSIRKRRNGNETALEKNTRPRKAGMNAKA